MASLTRRNIKVLDTEVVGFGAQMTRNGSGSYFVAYTDDTGRKCHEKLAGVGAISSHTARDLARLRLADIAQTKTEGRVVKRTACPTVSDFFYDRYLTRLRSEQRRYETHASIFRNHIVGELGHLRLDSVNDTHVLALQEALRRKEVAGGKWATQAGKTLSDGTVKRILILVRHLFNVALAEKVPGLRENPTRQLRLTTVRKVKGKFLTREELQRLVAAAERIAPDFLDAIKLMATTGMRRANVLAMQWSWVNLEQGTVTVPPEHDKAKQGFTKYLSKPALNVLLKLYRGMADDRPACVWVLPNPKTGKPYSSRRWLWETVTREAGLQGLRYHDLRHTFASMMLESGADIIDVQKALGHTQLKTTAVYLHLTDSRKRQKADAAAVQMGF